MALNPPTTEQGKLKRVYLASFVLMFVFGFSANVWERVRADTEQNALRQKQTDAETRFSNDLADVKRTSYAMSDFMTHLPKGMTREQAASLFQTYLNTLKTNSPGQLKMLSSLSNDDLRAMGKDIASRLWEKERPFASADSLFDSVGGPSEQMQIASARRSQLTKDFMADPNNKQLFLDANFLEEAMLVRLGRDIPVERWFNEQTLNWRNFAPRVRQLENLVDQLPH